MFRLFAHRFIADNSVCAVQIPTEQEFIVTPTGIAQLSQDELCLEGICKILPLQAEHLPSLSCLVAFSNTSATVQQILDSCSLICQPFIPQTHVSITRRGDVVSFWTKQDAELLIQAQDKWKRIQLWPIESGFFQME